MTVGDAVLAARVAGVYALADGVDRAAEGFGPSVREAVEALAAAGEAAAGLGTGVALLEVAGLLAERLDTATRDVRDAAERMRGAMQGLVDGDGEVAAGVRAAG